MGLLSTELMLSELFCLHVNPKPLHIMHAPEWPCMACVVLLLLLPPLLLLLLLLLLKMPLPD